MAVEAMPRDVALSIAAIAVVLFAVTLCVCRPPKAGEAAPQRWRPRELAKPDEGTRADAPQADPASFLWEHLWGAPVPAAERGPGRPAGPATGRVARGAGARPGLPSRARSTSERPVEAWVRVPRGQEHRHTVPQVVQDDSE